jgi:hypothetical protein
MTDFSNETNETIPSVTTLDHHTHPFPRRRSVSAAQNVLFEAQRESHCLCHHLHKSMRIFLPLLVLGAPSSIVVVWDFVTADEANSCFIVCNNREQQRKRYTRNVVTERKTSKMTGKALWQRRLLVCIAC